jgi:beta-mannanase
MVKNQNAIKNKKKPSMMQLLLLFVIVSFCYTPAEAQLKFLLEDFEGLADGSSGLKENGVFSFGFAKVEVDSKVHAVPLDYCGRKALRIERTDKPAYGGWGKGIGANIDLVPTEDYLNFYVYFPLNTPLVEASNALKIELQEDDNQDNVYKREQDDSWTYTLVIENVPVAKKAEEQWSLISIPLSKFKDDNPGGDGDFNISYQEGKLFSVIFSFVGENNFRVKQECYFDFVCFSKGKLPQGKTTFSAPAAAKNDFCSLGAWSAEGNTAHFAEIGGVFEKHFESGSHKKLGVVHFFQPFGKEDQNKLIQYPSVERINKVIKQGYLPMITLENHFVNSTPNAKQPNLYSIVEGHFDSFFGYWASQIKQVNGVVLLRILHEFNGDWYPWCVVNNSKNPELLAKAFRYIHNIFKENKVNNVKFIWCPNSMSVPQESWNQIMNAYPGDEYVDYVGLDIYNGAGKSTTWRSFRREGIENYFVLTQKLPHKPLFICEVASREKKGSEPNSLQSKADWIQQMSEALKSDMSKIKLLTWFNEKETFKINSSREAKNAFLNYVMKDDYFKSGTEYIYPLIKP